MGVIRFILAASVVIFHSRRPAFGLTMVDGFAAVQLFFVISGFYMSMILNGKYTKYWPFIINRLLKLYPAYWVVLTLCYIYSNGLGYEHLPLAERIFFSVSNLLILGSHFTAILMHNGADFHFLAFGAPLSAASMSWAFLYIGPIWSLSVEMLFYFAAPFLVTGSRYFWKISGMILISVVTCGYLFSKNAWSLPWNYNFLLPTLYLFALGSLSWRFQKSACFIAIYKPVAGFLAFLSMLAYVVCYQFIPDRINLVLLNITFDRTSLGVCLFTMLLPFVFEFSRRSKLDGMIGALSYPVYISHFFFLYYFPYCKETNPLVGTILLSVLIDFVLIRNIDKVRSVIAK